MSTTSMRTRSLACLAAGAVAAALAGCASPAPAPAPTGDASMIGPERCEANRAAGTINFLTSYVYVASVGILDVVAAEELGYFDDLCLDVELQAGVANNAQLVAAGTAQIGGLGSASDVLVARDKDAEDIVAIATYGSQGAMELLTMADSGFETLEDFVGRTVGYKGAVAPQLEAMFKDNGIDPSSIGWVSVGYDPQILPDGQIDALAAYKSNEPMVLAERGYEVVEWAPEDFGVESTFNVQIANRTWAEAHPTAVEDFLRASFKAYAWLNADEANLEQALQWAADRSDSGYDFEQGRQRWRTEVAMVESSRDPALGLGVQTEAQWASELELVVEYGLVTGTPSFRESADNRYLDAIYDGAELLWPAL